MDTNEIKAINTKIEDINKKMAQLEVKLKSIDEQIELTKKELSRYYQLKEIEEININEELQKLTEEINLLFNELPSNLQEEIKKLLK